MKLFTEEIQQFLIEEFEKRGVTQSWQIAKTHKEVSIAYQLMLSFPEYLFVKDIKTMLNWLEIDTIELEKIKITFKI